MEALLAPRFVQAAQVFSNNVLWFRADVDVFEDTLATDAAENGDGVAFWGDQSAGPIDATQTASLRRPTYVTGSALNGLPALSFSTAGGATGSDALDNTLTNPATGDRTVLIAGMADNANTGGTLFTFRRTGPVNTLALMDLGPFYVYSDGVTVSQTIANALTEVKSPFVTSYKSAVGVPLGVDINGTQRPTSGGNTANDTGTTGFSIGARADQVPGTYDWNGLIGEVIVYSRRLNAAENAIATNYLSSKYGTTMAGSDLYAGDTLANNHYDFEVFGVGQSAATSSGSAAGNVVTGTSETGLEIAADLPTLGDGDFILAGQQAGANSLTSLDVPAGMSDRWSRVWYVDQTGALDATLTFDFSESGLAFPPSDPAPLFALLYSPTDPYSFSLVDAVATVSGDQISFFLASADLADGYYTLALMQVPEPGTGALLGFGAVVLAWSVRRRKTG